MKQYEHTIENLYRKIDMQEQAEQFGLDNRMLQCVEECAELTQAIIKYLRVTDHDITCRKTLTQVHEDITEEIADVEILLTQLKYLLKNSDEVEQVKEVKIKRTLELLSKNK